MPNTSLALKSIDTFQVWEQFCEQLAVIRTLVNKDQMDPSDNLSVYISASQFLCHAAQITQSSCQLVVQLSTIPHVFARLVMTINISVLRQVA